MVLSNETRTDSTLTGTIWTSLKRFWYKPVLHEQPSARRSIAEALGPEFAGTGLFRVVMAAVGGLGLLLMIGLCGLIWMNFNMTLDQVSQILRGPGTRYGHVFVVVSLVGITLYPLSALAALKQRWQAPAQELALLAHVPGLGSPSACKRRAVLASLSTTVSFLYIATFLSVAMTNALQLNWVASMFQIGVALATTLVLICFVLAILGGKTSNIPSVLLKVWYWIVVATTALAYLNLADGRITPANTGWLCALILVWPLTLFIALIIGCDGYRGLRARAHPFLANR